MKNKKRTKALKNGFPMWFLGGAPTVSMLNEWQDATLDGFTKMRNVDKRSR